MTTDDQIIDEKRQYDFNREAAKTSDKFNKYENFTNFPLGKAFEEERKTTKDQGKKQVDA